MTLKNATAPGRTGARAVVGAAGASSTSHYTTATPHESLPPHDCSSSDKPVVVPACTTPGWRSHTIRLSPLDEFLPEERT